MTTLLSDKSGGVLASIVEKGQQFADSVTKATDDAVKAIEGKGLTFSQSMLSKSEELARMINTAGETATSAVSSTMSELQNVAQTAIQQAKQTSAASVSEMLETHNMLRADSTALYERLREANILLQEVLTGAHQNMSVLENTMMMRVTDFVSAMKEVTEGTNTASDSVSRTIGDFRETTARVVTDLGQLTIRFEQHGRELAKAIELIERSNIRTEDAVNERRVTLDSLISTLDIRTEDLDQRLKRFSALLDESLDAAGGRAREIARVVSESSVESAHVIADQFEAMREAAETERRATAESMRNVYEQSTGDSQMMLRQAAERFTEIMDAMKQMSGEMQQQLKTTREDMRRGIMELPQEAAEAAAQMRSELETTREELRRGIMELPQETAEAAAQIRSELEATREELRRGILELPRETADSATQMRRVLVDQIEALAELNRIVARHSRSLEQSEPRRTVRAERTDAPQVSRPTAASYAPPARRTDTAAQVAANKGWLTDLLNRASRDEDELAGENRPAPAPAPVVSRPSDERTPRHSIESLDSLSVDIARMIDHDAAADLWDRYKRGERNVFTRRLYTLQGQKAFDEIRTKYRADREFKQTVDRYIAEFERLLEDVSRDDRGQVVARTYLTSETGKVYTMLAHAAGRFDQAQ
jgi:gas vesicle protein